MMMNRWNRNYNEKPSKDNTTRTRREQSWISNERARERANYYSEYWSTQRYQVSWVTFFHSVTPESSRRCSHWKCNSFVFMDVYVEQLRIRGRRMSGTVWSSAASYQTVLLFRSHAVPARATRVHIYPWRATCKDLCFIIKNAWQKLIDQIISICSSPNIRYINPPKSRYRPIQTTQSLLPSSYTDRAWNNR